MSRSLRRRKRLRGRTVRRRRRTFGRRVTEFTRRRSASFRPRRATSTAFKPALRTSCPRKPRKRTFGKNENWRVDFSPRPDETDGEAQNLGPRVCKRGYRSQEARERRVKKNAMHALVQQARLALESAEVVVNDASRLLQEVQCDTEQTEATIEPLKDLTSSSNISRLNNTTNHMYAFEFFHCNLNGFATNSAKVMTAIRLRSNVPHVVFLNETKTDEGDKLFSLEGFVKI